MFPEEDQLSEDIEIVVEFENGDRLGYGRDYEGSN